MAWWCDELQDWEIENITWGLRKWNRDNPRLRPTPGDIVKILMAQRGKAVAARMAKKAPAPEPDRPKLTPEELAHRKKVADEVLNGFKGG